MNTFHTSRRAPGGKLQIALHNNSAEHKKPNSSLTLMQIHPKAFHHLQLFQIRPLKVKDHFSPQSRTCFASKVLQKCLLFVADKCTEKNRSVSESEKNWSVSESESCFVPFYTFLPALYLLCTFLQLLKSRLDMIAADWFDHQI